MCCTIPLLFWCGQVDLLGIYVRLVYFHNFALQCGFLPLVWIMVLVALLVSMLLVSSHLIIYSPHNKLKDLFKNDKMHSFLLPLLYTGKIEEPALPRGRLVN